MGELHKENLQEDQYHFPYHHLAHITKDGFFTFKHLFWGLEHITYINFVIDKINELEYKTLVDVGCGEGRIISELENNKLASYTGVDISSRALHFARGFTNRADFFVHDITRKPLEQKSDVIISCEVIEHILPKKVDDYVRHISESIQNGGIFILTTPTTNVVTNGKHYQHFTHESLESHLNPYFEIEEVCYLNKKGLFGKILERCLANRLFLLNTPKLNRSILNLYRSKVLIGNSETGSRIFIKCRKLI